MSNYITKAISSNDIYNGSAIINAMPLGNYDVDSCDISYDMTNKNLPYISGYYHTSVSGVSLIKSGNGILYGFSVNSLPASGSSMILYDNVVNSGTIIGSYNIDNFTMPISIEYNSGLKFTNGLTIHRIGDWDSTLIYE